MLKKIQHFAVSITGQFMTTEIISEFTFYLCINRNKLSSPKGIFFKKYFSIFNEFAGKLNLNSLSVR